MNKTGAQFWNLCTMSQRFPKSSPGNFWSPSLSTKMRTPSKTGMACKCWRSRSSLKSRCFCVKWCRRKEHMRISSKKRQSWKSHTLLASNRVTLSITGRSSSGFKNWLKRQTRTGSSCLTFLSNRIKNHLLEDSRDLLLQPEIGRNTGAIGRFLGEVSAMRYHYNSRAVVMHFSKLSRLIKRR